MSATIFGRPGQIPPQGLGSIFGTGPVAEGSVGVIENLETVLMSARQMEIALVQERKRVRAYQEELNNQQASYERLLVEARAKGDENTQQEVQLKSALSKYQEHDKVLREKLTTLSAGYRKAVAELQHYKNTWAGVLQREREARMIIQDSQRTINRATELEQQNRGLSEALTNERKAREQFERHAKSYQQELQNALVRLHSSESKFAELTREFTAIQTNRKSLDQEVAHIEKTMRERFEWEAIRERERMKAEFEKEAAVINDRSRMEFEQRFDAERTRTELIEASLENEIRRLRHAQTEAESKINALAEALKTAEAKAAAIPEPKIIEKTIEIEKAVEVFRSESEQVLAERVRGLESKLALVQADSQRKIAETERRLTQELIDQRTQTASRMARMKRARRAGNDGETLKLSLDAETARADSLEQALIAEKNRFDQMTAVLESEVNRLRSVYPLQDLLKVKEDEVARIQSQVNRIVEGSVLRTKAESALALHREQIERLKRMIADANQRIQEQSERIAAAREVNTILAEPENSATVSM